MPYTKLLLASASLMLLMGCSLLRNVQESPECDRTKPDGG